jgi:hypothetical protein
LQKGRGLVGCTTVIVPDFDCKSTQGRRGKGEGIAEKGTIYFVEGYGE